MRVAPIGLIGPRGDADTYTEHRRTSQTQNPSA